jgi:putative colanic acid biosynthesis UDP-glucose lipid carrier transferase
MYKSKASELSGEAPETQTEAEIAPVANGRRRTPVARAVWGDLLQFADFMFVTAASIVVAAVYHDAQALEFDFQRYAAAGLVGATGITAILRRDGFYEFERLVSPTRTGRAVLSRWALVILGLIAFGFALKVSENFSRVWLFAWTATAGVGLVAMRLVASGVLRRTVKAGGVFSRRVAIVGRNAVAEKFKELAEKSESAVTVVGVYDVKFDDLATTPAFDLTGNLAALARAARAGEIDDIVIAAPSVSGADMDALVRRLSILPCSIAVCPSLHWLNHTGGEIVKIGAAPLLNLYRRPLESWGGFVKTLEDKLLGTLGFVLAAPFILVIAALIKLQDGGSVFFKQKRHGFNNEVFTIYKFRTMTVAEDDDDVRQATEDDPRVTPLGRFLRRYSLDELPQLFNVLRGEMSLVGPRPHALAHNHAYAQAIENYSGRHKMKPGITGWAQVNGYRGETSENELMAERVRYDLEYIDNWSLFFDLKILVLTAAAVLFPRNAY